MSDRSVDVINIVPGNFCNLHCSHCVNESGPNRRDKLEPNELDAIVQELNKVQPPLIMFTGGEPSLHINIINEIISRLRYSSSSFKVQITTNGWFAKSENKLNEVISSFLQLNTVQLSYDAFHGSKLSQDDVRRLAKACKSLKVNFNITMCISNPLELIEADRLSKDLGIKIIYQKVAAVGRAKATGVEFKQPRFDHTVLERSCPNLDTLNYIHGKGFTFCCGPLVFETNAPIAHPTIESHMKSEIRRKFETKNFGELLHESGGKESELTPSASHPCALCFHIQRRGRCAKNS